MQPNLSIAAVLCRLKHPVEGAALWNIFEREALLETLDETWCEFIAQLDGLKAATDVRWGSISGFRA